MRCTVSISTRRGWYAAAFRVGLTGVALSCGMSAAHAQTLDHDFWIVAQAYYPRIDTQVRVETTSAAIGTDIDFEKDLDLDKEEVLPAVSAGARFGRVIVGLDFFKLKREGSIALAREIRFDDTVYPVSARIDSSFDSDIYRLTVGYAVVQSETVELGAAIGVHATRFDLSLEGEASAGGGSIEARRRRRDFLAPIPTIGLFGTWQVAPRLELTGRVDYLSLKISDYDGRLINVQAGIAYRLFDNVSIGAAYRYVDYRVDVEKEVWQGRVHYKLNGPAVQLQASF